MSKKKDETWKQVLYNNSENPERAIFVAKTQQCRDVNNERK